ncbi:hypothetical protein VMCG_10814 [Cytospora schulzeri]|uniref:Serine hydrolase domain-containing protein n=1 Tax=Cytospora schulzeri TaxID=448051 RepID=A0A423V7T5_9PEZI|nr:hypothetical protein VMCG_10814 [Valsa malicola]
MRFLCLHGMGTNSKIFEMQTAAIRHALGSQHSFEFIDGAVPAEMAPGVKAFAGPEDECLQYVDYNSTESCLKGLHDLEKLVDEEGPFDGVMSFSLGATLAASLMVHKLLKDPRMERLQPIFRCAIFFCGGIPEVISEGNHAERRTLSFEADGELIDVPTAHIWGANDQLYPTFGVVLSQLCNENKKSVFVHQGGHEIPGPKDPDSLQQAIRVIKRAIERADEQQ